MATIKKEGKVKLMEAKGDLAYVAEALGISEADADALRTYEQFHFDSDSKIVQAIANGVKDAVKVVSKSSLEGEAKQIVTLAVEGLIASIPSLLVSGQNQAVIEVREIPRKATVAKTVAGVAPVAQDDI